MLFRSENSGNCFSIGSPSSKSRAASRPLLAHVITAVATATAIAPAATNPMSDNDVFFIVFRLNTVSYNSSDTSTSVHRGQYRAFSIL